MRVINRISACCCCLLSMVIGGVQTRAATHIDATTRNHSVSKDTVVVAKNGTAMLPIIISEKADKDIQTAANELIACLGKMTGAKFELKLGGNGPGIYVGAIADFPTPSATDGLKIFDYYDGKEAYAIRTEKDRIKLLGATSLGTNYAVNRFLEMLGCRFFFQSPIWTVVPKAPSVTFNQNETDRPEMLMRYLGYPLTSCYEKDDPDAGGLLRAWLRHNRVGKSLQTSVGHCWPEIVRRFQKEFEEHPEYRALPVKGGERTGGGKTGKDFSAWGQLCVSNPRVIQMGIQYANEFFDKNPDADMIGVGPDDGGGYCVCDECAKFGNPGNQAFYFANEVAKALQKSHPGKFVGIYAYNWHCDPPDFALEPNVYVELTTALLLNTKYGFDELVTLWPKKCHYLGLYDYWAVYDWIRDRLPSGRTGNMEYVAEKLPWYIKCGACGLSAESGNSWGSQGLGYYLGARVLWNSKTDVEAVKKDFYQKAFGPAAQAMKTYYERIDLGKKPLVGPTFYRLCLDDLTKAEQAAQGNPDVLARIEQIKEYHVFVYLLDKTNEAGLDPDLQKKYALEMLKWNYRMRNSYMTFWSFFADQTTSQLSARFKEESWWWWKMFSIGKGNDIPYRIPDPITVAETDQHLQKIKAAYGDPPQISEVHFSKHLVAPKWDAVPPTTVWSSLSQGTFSMAFASMDGEPLKFTIEHGTIYKNFPDGKYSLTDTDGKVVLEGRVPYGKTDMELKVPAAGVYYFHYDDIAAGAAFMPSTATKAAYIVERGDYFPIYRHNLLYFYVPKGTANLDLYANRGNKFAIYLPDGKPAGKTEEGQKPDSLHRNIPSDGSYQVIPVPKGMDGKVWSAYEMISGTYHFFNIPNIFFVNPDNVLVPEEVAKKDGLLPTDDKKKPTVGDTKKEGGK